MAFLGGRGCHVPVSVMGSPRKDPKIGFSAGPAQDQVELDSPKGMSMDTDQAVADHWLSLARHTPLGVICDLDGTLIPFADTPAESRVPPEVAEVLSRLNGLPGLHLVVVSGRRREDLERLLATVPGLWLAAEHGGWRRGDGAWEVAVDVRPEDVDGLAEDLLRISSTIPGTLVERKTWSVTFHYRRVPARERSAMQVAVDAAIEAWLVPARGFQRLDGHDIVEVRPTKMRKSLAVPWIQGRAGAGARLLALGDDLTDEDVFRALGVADETVLVGRPRRSRAKWVLSSPDEAVALLDFIVRIRGGSAAPPGALPRRLVPVPPASSRVRGACELLVVSNRLPDLRRPTEPGVEGKQASVGGLVSALEPALSSRRGLWLGWSGHTTSEEEPGPVQLSDDTRPALAWIDFPEKWYRCHYNGFCNRALWPLFHSFPGRAVFADEEWDFYRRVNRAFATAAGELVGTETPIWLHDYHLLLTGRALRELGHRGPLGLFLHIPFPPSDLFALLPWASEILDAMLDFDLIGFHTRGYVENFRHTVGSLSPARVSDDAIEHRARRVRVGPFPIGIMPEPFQQAGDVAAIEEAAGLLRAIAPGRLILGVDRLDYTKGIPERLDAFGRLLALKPEWRDHVSLVQISAPSRADVPEYVEQRGRIEKIVGRINGEYGGPAWVPVRYLYRQFTQAQLTALYRAAAIGYVTPLRDGMNLVAKEYVAAQDPADPGVLLLSRFAGAADELKDAVLTNPWHADGMALDLDRALRMGLEERQERHRKLVAVVSRTTAASWAEDFLGALTTCR